MSVLCFDVVALRLHAVHHERRVLLKHENEILQRKVEGLEKVLEIKSNDSVSITTSEMDDEKELEKEEVSLD